MQPPSLAGPIATATRDPTGTVNPAIVGEQPGDQAGPYRWLWQIGEGNVGVVVMAEREAPVQRRVARKVLKSGVDMMSVVAGFESKWQALALMDHLNIAKATGRRLTGKTFFTEFDALIRTPAYISTDAQTSERADQQHRVCDPPRLRSSWKATCLRVQ